MAHILVGFNVYFNLTQDLLERRHSADLTFGLVVKDLGSKPELSSPDRSNRMRLRTALLNDEHILYQTRQHWISVGLPAFGVLVASVGSGLMAVLLSSPLVVCFPFGVIGMVFGVLFGAARSRIILTNRRIIAIGGVLTPRICELWLNRLAAIAVRQSRVGRSLGYGSVMIYSSDEDARLFTRVGSPIEFYRLLLESVDSNRKKLSNTA